MPILKNDGVRQWVSDDIPYMKWKIKAIFETTNQLHVSIMVNAPGNRPLGSSMIIILPGHAPNENSNISWLKHVEPIMSTFICT